MNWSALVKAIRTKFNEKWILILTMLFTVIFLGFTGCLPYNKRISIEMDDLGETQRYHTDWDTTYGEPLFSTREKDNAKQH